MVRTNVLVIGINKHILFLIHCIGARSCVQPVNRWQCIGHPMYLLFSWRLGPSPCNCDHFLLQVWGHVCVGYLLMCLHVMLPSICKHWTCGRLSWCFLATHGERALFAHEILVLLQDFIHLMLLSQPFLQRFENIYGGKIDRHVVFEERLCLTGHMCRASKVCWWPVMDSVWNVYVLRMCSVELWLVSYNNLSTVL